MYKTMAKVGKEYHVECANEGSILIILNVDTKKEHVPKQLVVS